MRALLFMRKAFIISIFCFSFIGAFAQNTILRGFVYEESTGSPIISALVTIQETKQGSYTDERGFFNIVNVEEGSYSLVASVLGYKADTIIVKVRKSGVVAQNFYLKSTDSELKGVNVTAKGIRKTTEVSISKTTIKPIQLQRIPSVGGEPDLVQYLQVLPGVVFSGDQGGQLYIRGGSPVMNRVMLDGLTVYNPFHSIGLFSVFDSDILKSVDVYSAGFSAEYGGRVSAIVDVQTRDGNRNEFSGKLAVSPFNAKILLEGPLKKYEAGKSSSSYIISYKNSYLNRTAPTIYPFVNDGNLPYSFSDLYAKLSFNSASGSNINVFGFDYSDNVNFAGIANYGWTSRGLGSKFLLVPGTSKTIIDGSFNFSNYAISREEASSKPSSSGISGFNVDLRFTRFLNDLDKLKYGLEMNGFSTDFEIFNSLNRRIDQRENTSEVNAFVNYIKNFNKRVVLEAGIRLQRYATLQENSWEPRVRLKYNINPRLRFKASAGVYSQNLMSASSDRDVVNLFYGFLSGPEDLPDEFLGKPVDTKLQKARHAVAGFEFDLSALQEVNVEGYIKVFDQVTNVNRDKIFDNSPDNQDKPSGLREDYVIENGEAYGFDITYKLDHDKWYIWTVYSFNIVNRFDGTREYQPHFDRRHNINVVTSYDFGKDKAWNANMRWNFGSGFPFTLTQGFYEQLNFSGGAGTDITGANGELGVNYDELNRGRLPYYHRLDVAVKRTFKYKSKKSLKDRKIEVIGSVTNLYNRENIFYFDRINYQREDQLPLLPSLSISYKF